MSEKKPGFLDSVAEEMSRSRVEPTSLQGIRAIAKGGLQKVGKALGLAGEAAKKAAAQEPFVHRYLEEAGDKVVDAVGTSLQHAVHKVSQAAKVDKCAKQA